MTKHKHRWLAVEISRKADRLTKRVAKLCGVSQARVLCILITLELEKEMLKKRP